jgi:hypothetical protein
MTRCCCMSGVIRQGGPGLCVEITSRAGRILTSTFTDGTGRFRLVMMPDQRGESAVLTVWRGMTRLFQREVVIGDVTLALD